MIQSICGNDRGCKAKLTDREPGGNFREQPLADTILHPAVSFCDMAYFEELSRYEYSDNLFGCVGEPRSVGWIERCAPYSRGVVDQELTVKLLALCKYPVNRYRGWHGCHFCKEYPVRITDSDGESCLGDGEIRVPAADGSLTYVAPNLIYHYVTAHEYGPPDVFLDALRAFSLPNPAVDWILEWIDSFKHRQTEVVVLSHLLSWILQRKRPSLPPELRGVVLRATNDLKAAQKAMGQDPTGCPTASSAT